MALPFSVPLAITGAVKEPIGFIYPVKRVSLGSPKLTAFEIDATVSEHHDFESEVTEHPVEGGSNVADNIRNKPSSLKLDCVVSNTPIMRGQDVEAMGGLRKGQLGRAEDAFRTLMGLRDAQQLITVATRLNTYPNMAIVSISVPRDAKTGDALRFTIVLKEVRIIASQYVSYAKEPRGAKKAALGDKPTTETEDDGTKKRARSAAKAIKDNGVAGLKKLFGGG